MPKQNKNNLSDLISKYKANPDGIRNEQALREICIDCGSSNVRSKNEKQHYFKVCQACHTEWYVNHCWNCNERVDSRDIKNPKCSTCGWLKCICGACNYGGCITNPYNKNNKLKNIKKNNDQNLDDSFIDDNCIPETCDWCDSPNVAYRDGTYTLCDSCSDQLSGD